MTGGTEQPMTSARTSGVHICRGYTIEDIRSDLVVFELYSTLSATAGDHVGGVVQRGCHRRARGGGGGGGGYVPLCPPACTINYLITTCIFLTNTKCTHNTP